MQGAIQVLSFTFFTCISIIREGDLTIRLQILLMGDV